MLLCELITLRQLHLPVKVIVFNNAALSFVELEMKAAGIVTYGTDLDNPDFAAIAPRNRAVPLAGGRCSSCKRPGPACRGQGTSCGGAPRPPCATRRANAGLGLAGQPSGAIPLGPPLRVSQC